MFLKVPKGFQQKKFSSCADTKLVPRPDLSTPILQALNIFILYKYKYK